MKSILPFALIAIALSSCLSDNNELAAVGRGYTQAYDESDFYYYDGGAHPGFYNGGYGSFTVGYSYYRGPHYQCPVCNSHPCKGHNGKPNSFVQHSHRSHDTETLYTHKSGGVHGGASEAHSKEWFTSRDYSPSRLEKTDHHGQTSIRSDHDRDDHKRSSSATTSAPASHGFSSSFVDRVKADVHTSSGNGGGSGSSSGHSSGSSSSHSGNSKDDDNSKKR